MANYNPYYPPLEGAKLVFLTDYPTERSYELGLPLAGTEGELLSKLCENAKINYLDVYRTSLFKHPVVGGWNTLTGTKQEVSLASGIKAKAYPLIKVPTAKYPHMHYWKEMEKTFQEIRELRPNLVIALGAETSGVVIESEKFDKRRGTIHWSHILNCKVMPTYSPKEIFKNYALRFITIQDLRKAKQDMAYREIKRLRRKLHIYPSISDLQEWKKKILAAGRITIDIETVRHSLISCVGISISPTEAFIIPFLDQRERDCCYWRKEEFPLAWKILRDILSSNVEKILQNGLYDIQFLYEKFRIEVRNAKHDTMLLHHSMFPEMKKSLGFLSSIYTNEAAWKTMRDKEEKEDE